MAKRLTVDDPRHGTDAHPRTESVPGCVCVRCEDARRHNRRTYKLRQRGYSQRVPVAPVQRHLLALYEAGWNGERVAEVSGVSQATISEVLNGRRESVRRSTAEALLAVKAADKPHDVMVPALGSVRRLQALAAIGWTMRDICTRAGIQHRYGADLIWSKYPTMHADRAAAITKVYDELHMTPGPSSESRTRARNRGWSPPLAYDDIDNPHESPRQHVRRVRTNKATDVDETAILRRMAGERVPLNNAEARELVRRWQATGRSLKQCDITCGIKSDRYLDKEDAA